MPADTGAKARHWIIVRGVWIRVPRRAQRWWEFFAARWLNGSHTHSSYPGRRIYDR